MVRYLCLILFFVGYSQITIDNASLYYKQNKKIKVAKGKITYDVGFYKVVLDTGGIKKFPKSELIGITAPKPARLIELEKSSLDKILQDIQAVLLEDEIGAFGWAYYAKFLYALALIYKSNYAKAENYLSKIDRKAFLRRSIKGAKVDFKLLDTLKILIDIEKNKGEISDLTLEEIDKELNQKKLDKKVSVFLSYIKARALEKQGKTNLATIYYLKVVFLENDVSLYKVMSLEKIIKFYKLSNDTRSKAFEKILKKIKE